MAGTWRNVAGWEDGNDVLRHIAVEEALRDGEVRALVIDVKVGFLEEGAPEGVLR